MKRLCRAKITRHPRPRGEHRPHPAGHHGCSTSNLPFAAIAAGRNQLGPALREIGVLRPVVALAVYAVIFALHNRFIAPLT